VLAHSLPFLLSRRNKSAKTIDRHVRVL